MVYSFLMFILVRNAVQYALLALLYQLAQSGASGGLVDLLILRDETGAYNGYSGDVSSIIAALGFIGGAIAVWSTAKMLIDKNKEDMHLSHLKKEGKSKYVLLTVATIGAVIGCNLLFELQFIQDVLLQLHARGNLRQGHLPVQQAEHCTLCNE